MNVLDNNNTKKEDLAINEMDLKDEIKKYINKDKEQVIIKY